METTPHHIRIGTAGWSIPMAERTAFAAGPSILHRYATTFDSVEINSSFYRPHRRATYERWAASTPTHFRFAVKMPRAITHAGFADVLPTLDRFLDEVGGLGDRLGPLLVQTPASQVFAEEVVPRFLDELRQRFTGLVACEPRHRSWFTPEVDHLLRAHRIARVAADPSPVPAASQPSGWTGIAYYRLHGSPEIYTSSYDDGRLTPLATRLEAGVSSSDVWCIFDNTKLGHATSNALAVGKLLSAHRPVQSHASASSLITDS